MAALLLLLPDEIEVHSKCEITGAIVENILKNIAIKIPAYMVPVFKPSKEFASSVKTKVIVK